jgi:hypothetical protein
MLMARMVVTIGEHSLISQHISAYKVLSINSVSFDPLKLSIRHIEEGGGKFSIIDVKLRFRKIK